MKNWQHRLYIFILVVFATAFFAFLTFNYIDDLKVLDVLFWGALAIVAETFYIILPNDAATSVGMAVYLAALVTTNPLTAVIVPIIAFIFRMPEDEGKRKNLFSYHYTIVLYNISSHMIFVGIIAYVYDLIGIQIFEYTSLVPISLLLLTLSELLSIFLISMYFHTREGIQRIPLLRSFIRALPNTWAVGALGLLLVFAKNSYGYAVVAFFFIPLLLARSSFKLYFDSQKTGQDTIEALNSALNYRDAYTAGHTQRVEIYTVMLAKELKYTGKQLETIKTAARLHDIGKIGVPDMILNKPGSLTDEEYDRIKDHSSMGAQILSNVDGLKAVTEIVRQHHERPDGKGYPSGLKEDRISIDASILSIADTYDAMTSERPYRAALSKEYAISQLRKYRGTQFRSDLVEVFIEALENLNPEKLQFEKPVTYEDHMLAEKEEAIV